jgi:sortase A
MRLVVRIERLGRILKWVQRALFAGAVLFLGYCGFALADGWIFQRRESADLDRLLGEQRAVSSGTFRPESSALPNGASAVATDGLIGRLEIPRLGLSAVVVEGIGKTTLRRAVGHIPGTALPGQPGNVGISGHRDTFFRPLKDLKIKDEIQFSTLNGDFRYVVESLVVVDPNNLGVLALSSENLLTLVTCYPFYYIGAAPKRFVVRARQMPAQALARSPVE